MKAFLIAAAAACGVALAAPAAAQHNEHHTTMTVKHTTVERHGNWHGPRWTKKKVCKTVWRNHHKVRRCTWQRVRVR
jgi:hypothetical protein